MASLVGAFLSPRPAQRATLGGRISQPAAGEPRQTAGAQQQQQPQQLQQQQQPPHPQHSASSPRLETRGEAARSPRKCHTARGDLRAPTLSQLGSMLPRPGSHVTLPRPGSAVFFSQRSSPQLGSRGTLQEAKGGQVDTRSGVVYQQDGFELFYDIKGSENKPQPNGVREKRDGFDKFYGIRSSDKRCQSAIDVSDKRAQAAMAKSGLAATAIPEERAFDPATAPRLAVRSAQVPQKVSRAVSGPARVVAPAGGEDDFPSVEQYSVATPAHPGPPLAQSSVPTGVEVICMTPSVPQPGQRPASADSP